MQKIFLFLCALSASLYGIRPKIVGLLQVRNEEHYIEQCLRCLQPYVDGIVILDDGSQDHTLDIIRSLANCLPIEKIIANPTSKWEQGFESQNRQTLLEAGRKIGGTHFIIIDADEVLTANCMHNNYLHTLTLQLQPGESLQVRWFNFWRSTDSFRCDDSVWSMSLKETIFCDHPQAHYPQAFLHGGRLPKLPGKKFQLSPRYGIMHFQFVHWRNLLVKQAWYRCLEKIRSIRPISEINHMYGLSKNEANLHVQRAPQEWFNGYTFFDKTIYEKPTLWREEQVLNWFEHYGTEFFKDIDIWDVDWK